MREQCQGRRRGGWESNQVETRMYPTRTASSMDGMEGHLGAQWWREAGIDGMGRGKMITRMDKGDESRTGRRTHVAKSERNRTTNTEDGGRAGTRTTEGQETDHGMQDDIGRRNATAINAGAVKFMGEHAGQRTRSIRARWTRISGSTGYLYCCMRVPDGFELDGSAECEPSPWNGSRLEAEAMAHTHGENIGQKRLHSEDLRRVGAEENGVAEKECLLEIVPEFPEFTAREGSDWDETRVEHDLLSPCLHQELCIFLTPRTSPVRPRGSRAVAASPAASMRAGAASLRVSTAPDGGGMALIKRQGVNRAASFQFAGVNPVALGVNQISTASIFGVNSMDMAAV
ncbi:hypothetical protein C8R44DRAFT_856341 [Mycena epipterygia]|nr:hypothetical protein C8R44DRAFT_856341 [Mycena epipterygia]